MTARASIRGYARHRGCSPAAVRKALQNGRIMRGADGLIDVAAADAAWRANSDPVRTPAAPAPDSNSAFASARADNERLKALERELRVADQERRLVDRAEAERLFGAMQASTLAAWRSWPARVAAELAARLGTDPAATLAALSRVVDAQISELAPAAFDLGRG